MKSLHIGIVCLLALWPAGVPAQPSASTKAFTGARVIDGLDVLVAQGAAAFELWTGIAAPVEVMRAAVRAAG